jgi:hypothetical protein
MADQIIRHLKMGILSKNWIYDYTCITNSLSYDEQVYWTTEPGVQGESLTLYFESEFKEGILTTAGIAYLVRLKTLDSLIHFTI